MFGDIQQIRVDAEQRYQLFTDCLRHVRKAGILDGPNAGEGILLGGSQTRSSHYADRETRLCNIPTNSAAHGNSFSK